MRNERCEPDKTLKEISVELLDPSAWKHVEQGIWFHKGAIHNREAQTPTKACDLAYARRRCKHFHKVTQNRRLSAVGLVSLESF